MRDQFIQVYPLYLKTTYEYYLTMIEWCFYNVSDYNFGFAIGSQCYTYLWTFYEKMSIKTHDCDWDLTDLCNAAYHKLIDTLGHIAIWTNKYSTIRHVHSAVSAYTC